MSTSKRVFFVVAQQHFILAGGIGQFTKGFLEMARQLNWSVDLILDNLSSDAAKAFMDYLRKEVGVVWHYQPHQPLSYADFFTTAENRHKDGINFEKSINFRQAIYRALQDGKLPDLIVVNSAEAFLPIYSLGLPKRIPTVFYTHNENFVGIEDKVGPYSDEYNEIYKRILDLPDHVVATQSHTNMNRVGAKNWVVLPMPLSTSGLTTPYTGEKSGVLWIGRWEDRKDPSKYVRVIAETKLPAKVLTNEGGVAKFKEAFAASGVEDYVIYYNLHDIIKSNLIKSSKVFYAPHKKESFCYAVLECMNHCHVVLHSEYAWTDEFRNYESVVMVPKKDGATTVKTLYDIDVPKDSRPLDQYHFNALSTWAGFMNTRNPPKKVPQFNASQSVKLEDLFE